MGRILRTAACLVTGLALAATGALSTIPADAAPRCDVTFTTYHPIKAGSSGAQAKAMECLLHKAGYVTTVDGHFSASDTQELAKFRTSIGLNPLLVGGRRAWSALLSRGTTPHLQQGDNGKSVLRLQLALRSAGFAKIPTTARLRPRYCGSDQDHSEVARSHGDRRDQRRVLEGTPSGQDRVSYIKMKYMPYMGARRPG